jgi:membrane-associated protein
MSGDFVDWIKFVFDLFLHLDTHLGAIISEYGTWTYVILFIVIFCETGLVVTPFLPGDSLLFAAGTFAALGTLNPHLMFILLAIAALSGDNVNYFFGKYLGPKVFTTKIRFLKREYLERTHQFYEKHGGKTIIIARFIPIIRTFTPFVAGIGAMTYSKYILFCIVGAVTWTASFVYAGYFFGNIPFVRSNFSVVIIVIILISVMPGVITYIRHRLKSK